MKNNFYILTYFLNVCAHVCHVLYWRSEQSEGYNFLFNAYCCIGSIAGISSVLLPWSPGITQAARLSTGLYWLSHLTGPQEITYKKLLPLRVSIKEEFLQ